MDCLGLLIFVLYMILAALLVVVNFRLRQQKNKLVIDNAQLILDRAEVLKKLEQVVAINNAIEKTDGFLRFVTESRDWAFQYIEGIQAALAEYDNALSINDADKINDAYKKLVTFLPENNAE